MNDIILPPNIERILEKLRPNERAAVRKMLVDEKKKSEMEDQMEFFKSAQGTTQATAPSPKGQKVPFQKQQMFNPNNLAGTGGSLLQMSPPFDPSIRGQLTANRKREDMLFGIPMYYG